MKDLTIVQGASKSLPVTIKKNDVLLDITSKTISFTIKNEYGTADAEAIVIKTKSSHDDPTNGKTVFSLTSTETGGFPLGRFSYEIEMSEGSTINVLVAGTVKIAPKLKD